MTPLRRAFRGVGAVVLLLCVGLASPTGLLSGAAAAASGPDLQARIDAADPGAVLEIPAGTYPGGIVIDKPLTLRGRGAPVIDAGGKGDVVQVMASDVTIEGFVIRASGTSVTNADAGVIVGVDDQRISGVRIADNRIEDVLFGVSIERVDDAELVGNRVVGKDLNPSRRGDSIRIFESTAVLIEDNRILGGRDLALWYGADLVVRGNRLEESRYGLHSMYSRDVLLEDNVFRDNSVGAFLMYGSGLRVERNLFADNFGPSGYGLGLKDVDGADVIGNRFVANRVGIFNDNSPTEPEPLHHVTNNVIAFNEVGVLLMPSVQRNIFNDNAFIDNTDQVALTTTGRLQNDEWAEDGEGNYWSDYSGYDADGDGIGDRRYKVDDLFSSLKDSHPNLVFLTGTPAARAVDMAGRAFPDLRPEPKLVDPAPQVAVPGFPPLSAEDAPTSPEGVLAAAAAMLVLAGAILALTRTRRRAQVAPS
jgi:nitrous oxidase accessory protein